MKNLTLVGAVSIASVLAGCHVEADSYDDYETPTSATGTTGGSSDSNVTQIAYFVNEATLGIASDGNHVYVTTLSSTDGTGRVIQVGDDGALTLASGQPAPWAVIADDVFVYYSTRANGVSRVKKGGGEVPLALTGALNASGIALAGTNVYYASTDGIHRVGKSGGDDAVWAPDSNGADAVVADEQAVFWSDRGTTASPTSGAIMRGDVTTGAVTKLADGLSLASLTTFALSQDAVAVYFPDTANNRVYRIAKADGAVTTIAASARSPIAVAVDDTDAYILAADASGGLEGVESVATVGAANPLTFLASTASTGAYALAVDDTYVWFTNNVTSGGVYRLPKSLSAASGDSQSASGSQQ